MGTPDEDDPVDRERACGGEDPERFGRRYAAAADAGPLAVELEALGTDYGATGYTTLEQAHELGRRLRLTSRDILLDLGAGCGWPGLHLAARSGCTVISTDTVLEGASIARERILRDRLAGRAIAIVAEGEHLPLRPRSVDVVVHSDVMC